MAHGLNSVLKRGATAVGCKNEGKTGIGSRRIFAPHFKLQVLDSYRNDADCKGNQRATARKYGIHRRQIQKWLQVENNLRNSVVKRPAEAEPSDAAVPEARVPALSPVSVAPAPLDFTTHSRGSPFVASSPPPAADPAAPMDLSLKKPTPMAAGVVNAPATYCPPSPLRVPSPPSLAQPHPDVWDLSMSAKRKCEDPTPIVHSPTSSDCTAKPVKLFKPYLLDDVFDTDNKKTHHSPPPCCSSVLSNNSSEAYYYNNNNNTNINNNNNICDIKSEYSTTYTLHELQPKTSLNYYYTFPSTYHTSQEYEMNNPFCANYADDPNYIHSSVVPLKQRHSYSLDFKLSAIECYYQDSVCKGNQRAVATKYNIHRRQVQKWLKQADELRQKNETIKQTTTQTVR